MWLKLVLRFYAVVLGTCPANPAVFRVVDTVTVASLARRGR